MKKHQDKEVEKKYSLTEVASKLRRLADCLEKGEPFEMKLSGNRIYMPKNVDVYIEYENEGNEHELEFQFNWKIQDD